MATTNLYRREVLIQASPAIVYAFFTEADKLLKWKGISAELEFRVGGSYRLTIEAGRIAKGSYLAIESPTHLRFSWGWEGDESLPPGASMVTIDLQSKDVGTLLTLRHDGLTDGQLLFQSQGWEHYLPRLKEAIESST